MMRTEQDNWYYCPEHGELCRVIETQTLWGETVCRVWLPAKDTVVRLSATRLRPAREASVGTVDGIAYFAAAAKVADALTQDLSACSDAQAGVLLAPIESSVIPLPHQIRALSRAIAGDRVRYLLADEVGLGKTIEAGLILRELKLRGLVKRVLVIAPKGLVTQWVAEMRTHFNEDFRLLIPGDFSAYRRIAREDNIWQSHPQVVCPMDSVKPMESRRGWSAKQVAEYNQERFEDLVSAGWDLVIVDEAHRLGGSTDQVARYKLGQGLAEAAPYLLLLSATPHQGKTEQFRRLMSLLDPTAFPDLPAPQSAAARQAGVSSVTKERIQPYVIRTEKRRAIDAEGKPLFKPRRTELAPVSWPACRGEHDAGRKDRHRDQRLLYEAVTEYVREGYNQAMREKRSYIGFLMILMQRLVVSSTRAIRTTLERRLEALEAPQEQLTLFPQLSEEDWADLDGQEQMDTLLKTRLKALKNERAEVKLLLEAAKRCEAQGPDAKAEALLDWIYRLQAEEGDPDLKVLVFTEFVPTQEMLYGFLTERGITAVCLNGSMDMEERKRVQDAFAKDLSACDAQAGARILISTDAGGEGLNLQFCHVVINYDIPWNPMRLEQRIGRVDRIGQTHTVRAVNFVFEDSVEHRVLDVLEEKLAVIFEEFGIDKTGDVLDSAQAEKIFDDLYVEAILNPDAVETKVDDVLKSIREQARESRQSASVLGETSDLDPREAQRLLAHPLPAWIETMTVSWLRSRSDELKVMRTEHDGITVGAEIIAKEGPPTIWRLTWPDGTVHEGSFTHHSSLSPRYSKLGLEEPRIRGLAMRLPPFAPGQPVPVISLPALAPEIRGFWSLWEISIHFNSVLSTQSSALTRQRRVLPLFLADDGRVLVPTARHIWDQLLVTEPTILRHLPACRDACGAGRDIETSHQAFEQLREAAERQGKTIYDELVAAHRERLTREREKGEYAFAARRRAIERIGLPQVRNHRLSLLEEEEKRFHEQLERRAQILPELSPLTIVRVEASE